MKNEIILTIIIPAYNVEQFITKALDSIKNQKDNSINYEVLIIDDGSKDKTDSIVKKWIDVNKLNNFKYFLKENGNWGSVINYAKSNNLIKGRYFTILDADDYFLDNCFLELNKIINYDYDLVIGNFFRLNNNKLKKTKVIYTNKSKEIKKNRAFTAWSIPLCKFFKTDLFLKDIKKLKEKVSYQDQILFHTFVLHSKTIYFIKNKIGVYYENREGSSTSLRWDDNRIKTWCDNMNELLSYQNEQIAAYVSMMINHCYKNAENKNNVFIDKKNIEIIKKSKFCWLPLGTRILAKVVFKISNGKIIKNSLKRND